MTPKKYLVTGTRRQVFSRVVLASSRDEAMEAFEKGRFEPEEVEEDEFTADSAWFLNDDSTLEDLE